MTTLKSEQHLLTKPSMVVYDFLADLNNHKQLMPEQVVDWKSTTDTCTFTIKNTGTLSLSKGSMIVGSMIELKPSGKVPFDFKLLWKINETSNGGCTAEVVLEADLNPMLKMMAGKALQNFISMQADKLKTIMNS